MFLRSKSKEKVNLEDDLIQPIGDILAKKKDISRSILGLAIILFVVTIIELIVVLTGFFEFGIIKGIVSMLSLVQFLIAVILVSISWKKRC
ncbi:MAG TPA: hypothetical protein PKH80_03885 [Methanofastidiosum sp.]|nr:hypothetical protein [Methanofastidiosum sp.]HNU62233.1 hypothetical protein [Methanofastidiosum sp.]